MPRGGTTPHQVHISPTASTTPLSGRFPWKFSPFTLFCVWICLWAYWSQILWLSDQPPVFRLLQQNSNIRQCFSQSVILWFQGASQPKISGANHQNYLNTHLFSDILLPLRPATCAVTFYAVTFCNSAINVKYLWCQFFKNIWYYHKLQNFFC